MNDVLGMTMVDRLEEGLHVASSSGLGESLVCLLGDHVEELGAGNILHDQVDVLLVIVGLVILHDIGMVERMQDGNFFHDAVDIIPQLNLVKHFNCDLEIRVVNVRSMEHTAEGSDTEHLGV